MKTLPSLSEVVDSPPETKTVEVILKMSEDALLRVETLRKAVGYKTLAEFLTDSVEAYGTLLDARAKGRKIGFLDQRGETKVIFELPDYRPRGFGR